MANETILYEVSEGVALVTFNRPEAMNSLNDQCYREMQDLIGEVAADDAVGAVVLTGAGRAFCAGADVKAMNPGTPILARRKRHRWILSDILQPLVNLEKPVIAAVNGDAVGAGFNIALAADIIIASEAARFSQIFIRLGLVPDLGGLHLLTRIVGLNKAKELCFTGKKIDAQEALRLGIANHIVPADELLPEARKLAAEIAAGPATALAMTKMLLNKSSDTTFEQMLEYESFAQTLAYSTDEYREAVTAFREKRAPKFRSRD